MNAGKHRLGGGKNENERVHDGRGGCEGVGVWPPSNVLLVWLLPAALPEVWGGSHRGPSPVGSEVRLVWNCRVSIEIGAVGVVK